MGLAQQEALDMVRKLPKTDTWDDIMADATAERIIMACEDLAAFPKRGRMVREAGSRF